MKIMKYLLDTCVILWALLEPERLTKKVKAILTDEDVEIYISVISIAEVACAQNRKKIELNNHWKLWLRHYIKLNGWNYFEITSDIVEEAYSLPEPFHSDPSDRIIAATARIHKLVLLTGDKMLISNPHVDTIW